MKFEPGISAKIADLGQGYPYFVQLIGKQCVNEANARGTNIVDHDVFSKVLEDLRAGKAFPALESAYQRAIGGSEGRQLLLHLLAEQTTEETLFTDEIGRVLLKKSRQLAEELDIQFIDQLMPRLVDRKYGPVLERVPERQGVYEFLNPVLRQYIRLRTI